MKEKVFLVVLFFSISGSIYGQDKDLEQFFKQGLEGHTQEEQFELIIDEGLYYIYSELSIAAEILDTLQKRKATLELSNEAKTKLNIFLVEFYAVSGNAPAAREGAKFLTQRIENLQQDPVPKNLLQGMYYSLGAYQQLQVNLDSALHYFDLSLETAIELDDPELMYSSYLGKDYVYNLMGLYERSIENSLQALRLSEEINDTSFISTALNNIGVIYREMGEFQKAKEAHFRQLELAEYLGLEIEVGYVNANLSAIFLEEKDFENAVVFGNRAEQVFKDLGHHGLLSIVLMLIGRAQVHLGDIEEGTSNLEKSKALANEYEVWEALVYTNIGEAKIAEVANKKNVAEDHLKKAIEISNQYGLKRANLEGYKLLVEFYKQAGWFEEAVQTQAIYSQMQDSIFTAQKDFQISELEMQYETAKQEELIAKRTVELEQQRAHTANIIIALVVTLLMVAGLIFFYLKTRRARNQLEAQNKIISAQNEELDQLNATKDKFFSIIAHDLRSPMIALQGVGQKLEYFIRKEKQSKLMEMGTKIDSSIDRLNHLLNNLLNWAVSQKGNVPYHPREIDSKPLIEEVVELYDALAESKEIEIKTQLLGESLYVDLNTVSTVLRNLLSNAIKFTRDGGRIEISSRNEGAYTVIVIKDFGTGMSEKLQQSIFVTDTESRIGQAGERGFGLGLKLCKEFTEINKGTIRVESEVGKGTTFTVRYPSTKESVMRLHDVA